MAGGDLVRRLSDQEIIWTGEDRHRTGSGQEEI